ncbi:hypothetical protein BX600DRAFT_438549 [Xylariales sp. PMI_506]|nr:hypothetical protein BX600DRAFT_438549 [Xylariales sp. PMI_506]
MSEFPPYAPIPELTLHGGVKRDEIDASRIVDSWLGSFQEQLDKADFADLSNLFVKDSWWRDVIGLSMQITSKNGPGLIGEYLAASSWGFGHLRAIKHGALAATVVDADGAIYIQAGFTFETNLGYGEGILQLANVGPSEWKAWIVSSVLQKLHGQDELDARRNEKAKLWPGNSSITSGQPNGHVVPDPDDFQVIVVGAGQGGLCVAAHLKHLGLRYVVVDRVGRLGDSWRARYDTARTHTPSFIDHPAFMRLPSNWSKYPGRDQVAKWIENYGDIMGLNVMLGTNVSKYSYDETAGKWLVETESSEGKKVLRSTYLVSAVGFISSIPRRPQIPGEAEFKGLTYHSVSHKRALQIPDLGEKKVVIVGCGTTAHDIAQDLVNHKVKSVSMIQRNPIWSVSSNSIETYMMPLWNTPGMTIEEADLISMATPLGVARTLAIGWSQKMADNDRVMMDGLEKAGMLLRRDPKKGSLLDHQAVKGGSLYIDQGANNMIIDGRIKVEVCEGGVREFYEQGVTLTNGKNLDADVVIFATGYEKAGPVIRKLVGEDMFEKMGGFGALDDEQERKGWWCPTPVSNLWVMTGNFMWCRQYSQVIALQIGAIEKRLVPKN